MNLDINGELMFLYYNDLSEASKFYEEILSFELKLN